MPLSIENIVETVKKTEKESNKLNKIYLKEFLLPFKIKYYRKKDYRRHNRGQTRPH